MVLVYTTDAGLIAVIVRGMSISKKESRNCKK